LICTSTPFDKGIFAISQAKLYPLNPAENRYKWCFNAFVLHKTNSFQAKQAPRSDFDSHSLGNLMQ